MSLEIFEDAQVGWLPGIVFDDEPAIGEVDVAGRCGGVAHGDGAVAGDNEGEVAGGGRQGWAGDSQ